MIFYEVRRFKLSSCNAKSFIILIFLALQVFFNIFLLKWGVKWRRLWNFEFILFVFFFLFFLKIFIFTMMFPRWSSLRNSTLSNVFVQINVEIRCFKVDLTLSHIAASYQPKDIVETTSKCLFGIFSFLLANVNIMFVYFNKMEQKYFLSQSEGSIFANSTICCSVIGRKRAFSPLFWKMNLSSLSSFI